MERTCVRFGEVKLAADRPMEVEGYGAVFGNVDSYGDVIQPGAFADTLAEAQRTGIWPSMLAQHGGFFGSAQDMMPIGVWTSLAEDGHGLKVTGRLADTPRGQEVYALLKMQPRPALDGLSIGFQPIEFATRSSPEEPRRTLKRIKLMEVSFVTFPANGKARITATKSADDIHSIRDFEDFLRDVGKFSHAQAKAIASRGFKASGPRDEDEAGLAAAIRRNIAVLK